MGGRINTIMQTCFFALSEVLPKDLAIAAIRRSIEKTYGRKSRKVVEKNFAAVDMALSHLAKVAASSEAHGSAPRPWVPESAPGFRPRRHRADAGGARRRPAGERISARWILAGRHRSIREAQYRRRDTRVGSGDVHPVQQMRHGLPARRVARQGRPGETDGGRAGLRSRPCRSLAPTRKASAAISCRPRRKTAPAARCA